MSSSWTRRQLLEMAALAGGSAALHESMVAMGMAHPPEVGP